jgi:hypothetical protein
MHSEPLAALEHGPTLPFAADSSQAVYQALLKTDGADVERAASFLQSQLDIVAGMPCELPPHPDQLDAWAAARTQLVTEQYRAYLASRRAGAPRRYFKTTAHALYFIRCVAPTKLVDGAWLYGCLRQWHETDFQPLIKTYLEELGAGLPGKNHVTLYRKLLDQYGCDDMGDLSDAHFTQGAIQLALGYGGVSHQPEVVGYNLGYEQLPLHLLITAYELNELDIDPYYFTLHVTVDNGSTGHAHDAIAALKRLIARAADPQAFYRGVREGYKLNDLGQCTTSVIAAFDLESELVRVLGAKAVTGRDIHSDYCKVGGETMNAWLADPARIPDLLRTFERTGWIKRGLPPGESRFWRLIHGERAEMFGVFSAYEQQVLADWIVDAHAAGASAPAAPRSMTFRAKQRALEAVGGSAPKAGAARPLIRYRLGGEHGGASEDALRMLEQAVAAAPARADAVRIVLAHMSPARHHTALGLMATRLFCRLSA